MSKDGHHVYLGVTDSGTYVAATDSSPYFCFEGTTEGEVEEKAQKAFRFYLRVKGEVEKVRALSEDGAAAGMISLDHYR